MNMKERIRKEYETALAKKKELSEQLKQQEKTEPGNFKEIWIIRDQIAFWEGKTEGLQYALDVLDHE
jgi:pyridoxine/pyridoxamine 5'-phosphate oxidase